MLPIGIYAGMVFVLMFCVMREHMINLMYIECSCDQEWTRFILPDLEPFGVLSSYHSHDPRAPHTHRRTSV